VVEKITCGDERLPDRWPVQGTTGYDFMNVLNSLFVDPAGLQELEGAYRSMARRQDGFKDLVYQRKRAAAIEQFVPEFRRLSRRICAIAKRSGGPSLDEPAWHDVLVEASSCLLVYRTYINSGPVSQDDSQRIRQAIKGAAGRAPDLDRAARQFLQRVLLLEAPPPGRRKEWLRFVAQWQQVTGGLMAKGLEDSALYRYAPLVSMNDVSADPRGPKSTSLQAFHRWNSERLLSWPDTMNATSTHDTKRSEDVRARVNVLSEMPDEWSRIARRWSRANARHRSGGAPCPNDEWLLYQTLVGAWPLDDQDAPGFRERLASYMVKAARESAERTTWFDPDTDYERELVEFVHALFDDVSFKTELRQRSSKISWYGMLNSLSQVVLKIGSPGVSDFYQGSELWDFSLVDPDNRRPVDFAKRAGMFRDLCNVKEDVSSPADLREHWRDGRIKMHVTARALNARRENVSLFARGEYLPLYASGWARQHVVAFARRHGTRWAVVVAPRFLTGVAETGAWPLGEITWEGTELRLPGAPPNGLRNALTGVPVGLRRNRTRPTIALADLLDQLPVALLVT
jgi:(1->4)-alpha-D-glucan 1-alpha-D-glucosylmutase